MSQLIKIQEFRKDLAIAETYDEIKMLADKASAVADFARRNKLTKEKQDELGEFRIEIEAKKGAWLDEFYPQGRPEKRSNTSTFNSINDIGITKDESANARLIKNEPDTVKQVVEELKKDSKKVVTPYAVQQEIRKRNKGEQLKQKKQEYTQQSLKDVTNKPEIHIADAIDFLNTFGENAIDVLITDPPYMTDISDIHTFAADWLTVAINKLKPDGRAYICTGAYPEEMFAYLNVLTKQKKFIVDNPLIWTYRNTLGQTPKMKYNLNYQVIWHLYSQQSQDLDTSITNEMFSVQDINAPDGRHGNRLHTWQKPDELARRFVRHSTNETDTVVDCFACTGTFLLEAARLGRNAIGCEINTTNAKIAEGRGCTIIGK